MPNYFAKVFFGLAVAFSLQAANKYLQLFLISVKIFSYLRKIFGEKRIEGVSP